MKSRVIAAWTASDLHDYPDYVTILRDDDRFKIRIRGSDVSKDVTEVTLDRQAFLRLISYALQGALT